MVDNSNGRSNLDIVGLNPSEVKIFLCGPLNPSPWANTQVMGYL